MYVSPFSTTFFRSVEKGLFCVLFTKTKKNDTIYTFVWAKFIELSQFFYLKIDYFQPFFIIYNKAYYWFLKWIWAPKGVMQGKLIACILYVVYLHIETRSLLAEFVNKNRCIWCSISVRLVSEKVKSIKFW